MDLQLDSREGITIVTVRGAVDSYTVSELHKMIDSAIKTHTANLVLNLKGVEFMDSSGLATIVQGMKKCREGEGDLRLCHLQQPVQMILELTRLDKALEIFPTEADALASFQQT